MTQYSYTYKRHEMTEHEIQQAGAAQAELEAAKKIVINLFRDETTGEVYSLCRGCLDGFERNNSGNLTYIDKAGEWDICDYCEAQNIPADYHG